MNEKNEIILFENQGVKLEVNLKDETVWLNLEQMAKLFKRDKSVISRHIKNALNEELKDEVVIAKFATTTKHGAVEGKTQTHLVEYYNLDMILSVGYRVKSNKGIMFRRWANKILKDYMLKGYAINQKRLDYLEKTIKLIDIANRIDERLENNDAKEILKVIGEYSKALDLLDDYDHKTLKKIDGNIDERKIEGSKEVPYVFCEHDGIYIKKQKSKKNKGKKKFKVKHFKKKKGKNKKNGIELKIAVIHEGKESRYTNDYKLKNKIIVGTASKASHLKKIEDVTIGTTYKEYAIKNVVINGDGADWTGSIVEGAKEVFQLDMAHVQKKIYMAVSDEEYLKKMQEIVYTKDAKGIFSLIHNYKVELETDRKIAELDKVKELEEYLKNNEDGLLRYQYKLGYTEEQIEENKEKLPSLGSEKSHMYCVCRDRMKKNRTSWSPEGAEAMLKVIMNKMNGTIKEIITKKAEEKIKEELAQRIPEPKRIKKNKQEELIYAGKYEIASNFVGSTKKFVIDLLNGKKCSELMLIN